MDSDGWEPIGGSASAGGPTGTTLQKCDFDIACHRYPHQKELISHANQSEQRWMQYGAPEWSTASRSLSWHLSSAGAGSTGPRLLCPSQRSCSSQKPPMSRLRRQPALLLLLAALGCTVSWATGAHRVRTPRGFLCLHTYSTAAMRG